MSDARARAVALLTAAGQGEVAAVEALIGDDFVLEQMVRDPVTATSAAGTRYDRATYLGFLGLVRQMTQAGMNLSIERVVVDGEDVVAFGTSDALSPSGWAYRNAYCWHLTWRDGKFRRMREYYDTALANRLLAG